MSEIERLQALEREVEREWWWLNGALNAVAQAQVEGLPEAVRSITAQRRAIDKKRVEIATRMAELQGPN